MENHKKRVLGMLGTLASVIKVVPIDFFPRNTLGERDVDARPDYLAAIEGAATEVWNKSFGPLKMVCLLRPGAEAILRMQMELLRQTPVPEEYKEDAKKPLAALNLTCGPVDILIVDHEPALVYWRMDYDGLLSKLALGYTLALDLTPESCIPGGRP